MRWIALCDAAGPFGSHATHHARRSALLDCGSLVLEVALTADDSAGTVLLDFDLVQDWRRQFRVELAADGTLCLLQRQGRSTAGLCLSMNWPDQGGLLRLTYSWDAPRRTSRLTAEFPLLGLLADTVGQNPLPLPFEDVEALAQGGILAHVHPGLAWLGLAHGQEAIGHAPGAAGSTPIRTPSGQQRLDTLVAGDLVVTREHGALPVRWVGRSEMPARGSFAPICLRAPYFGSRCDLIVSLQQRVVLGGAEVEYLFGEDEVLVEARRLIDGRTAAPDRNRSLIRYHSVLLDEHAVLDADGCGLESLFLGVRNTGTSIYADMLLTGLPTSQCPRHGRQALPELRAYEATTLLAMRDQGRNPVAA